MSRVLRASPNDKQLTDEIIRLYTLECRSLDFIGRQLNCSGTFARNILVRENIPLRCKVEAMKKTMQAGVPRLFER